MAADQKTTAKNAMVSVNGPPIRTRTRTLGQLNNGAQLRIRESYGDTKDGTNRADVNVGKGWQDYAWIDRETKEEWHLWDAKGQVRLAKLGQSEWGEHGPVTPAERGCTECHKSIGVASENDQEFQAALIAQIVAVHGGWKDKPTKPPGPAPVVPGPQGPIGPVGPQGPRGEGINKAELATLIVEILTANKEVLRGPAGTNGTNGTNGEAGKTPTREELLVLIREIVREEKETLKGADGKPADETKITELKKEIDDLKKHTFRLLINDKDGKPTKNRDGSDNVTTFGFSKDGELRLVPVGL